MTATDQIQLLTLAEDAQNLLFREARTANTFSDEPVSDEQVRAIYDLIKWGPTSMNQQPLRIVLVRSEQGRERLLRHLVEGNRAKAAKAPLVAILAADTDFHENLPRTFPHAPKAKDMFVGNDEFRLSSARLNASLQIAYFILGVRAAGLAAGPMTGFDPAGLNAEFFPDGRQQALVVMNIGKPGENPWFDRLPRLDYDEVVTTV
ncbi:nitroreductase family protein [Saccharopolyspora subtropica]|uniref:Malonic semialdehyde reductase n=1 Tax=Saccharopolyspora thermophila TaxID=89367 RepID=A0A917JI01_9PSEU|nr:malonic semialdehyde reductase [Saccharopolyspora subtropica]GGI69696.1 nitroreductase family protein [Saccharopolyspora subtropica]